MAPFKLYLIFSKGSNRLKNKLVLSCAKLIFLWVRLPVRLSSCEVIFLWSLLPASLSSRKAVFMRDYHHLRLSSCEVVFLWGRFPVRSSSCKVVFLRGRLPVRLSSISKPPYKVLVSIFSYRVKKTWLRSLKANMIMQWVIVKTSQNPP